MIPALYSNAYLYGFLIQAYFLMQASEMKDIGDALAFGSALLFASVFGMPFFLFHASISFNLFVTRVAQLVRLFHC